jgi:FixJ family two-component response regulator
MHLRGMRGNGTLDTSNGGPGQPMAGELIYIVDDDATFARGIARLLDAAGWQSRIVTAAADMLAIEHAGDGSACVLLDVRMPGMKGPELYRAMLARRIDLPVIFLTGHGDVPTSVDAMKLGAADFLEKPVRGEVLIAAVRAALARHAEHRARERKRRAIGERVERLSPREHEVMLHVISGRLNKQIAADLGISEKTVKVHRANVMEKMEARSVAALVDASRDAGIGPLDPAAASPPHVRT